MYINMGRKSANDRDGKNELVNGNLIDGILVKELRGFVIQMTSC